MYMQSPHIHIPRTTSRVVFNSALQRLQHALYRFISVSVEPDEVSGGALVDVAREQAGDKLQVEPFGAVRWALAARGERLVERDRVPQIDERRRMLPGDLAVPGSSRPALT